MLCPIIPGMLNVFPKLFLVIAPHLGAGGVDIATVVSNIVSTEFAVWILLHKREGIRLDFRKLRLDTRLLKRNKAACAFRPGYVTGAVVLRAFWSLCGFPALEQFPGLNAGLMTGKLCGYGADPNLLLPFCLYRSTKRNFRKRCTAATIAVKEGAAMFSIQQILTVFLMLAMDLSLAACGTEAAVQPTPEIPEPPAQVQESPESVTDPSSESSEPGLEVTGGTETYRGFRMDNILHMIVAAPQLSDWGETSAEQAITLTEYLLGHYNIDRERVYAEGYSGGGETMSRVMGMRPELFTAYLQCSSRWDGDYEPVADARVPVYFVIGESDEYYGAEPSQEAYRRLHDLYTADGLTEEEIGRLLVLDIKDADYFRAGGAPNQHGGGNLFASDPEIMGWLFSQE